MEKERPRSHDPNFLPKNNLFAGNSRMWKRLKKGLRQKQASKQAIT
jgi:hypothetical protein